MVGKAPEEEEDDNTGPELRGDEKEGVIPVSVDGDPVRVVAAYEVREPIGRSMGGDRLHIRIEDKGVHERDE